MALETATTPGWDGSAVNTINFSAAYIEVTTYDTAITMKAGEGAANALQVINLADGSTASTITATGLYAVPAVGSLTATGIGAGVVNLILKR